MSEEQRIADRWAEEDRQQIQRIADLERQLADERARIDCATRDGWLTEGLECAGEDGPACWTHLLAEALELLHQRPNGPWDDSGTLDPSMSAEAWEEKVAHILKEEK